MHNKTVYPHPAIDHNPYLFQLKANQPAYIQDTIVADFSPVRALDIHDDGNRIKLFSIVPVFNGDGRFYSQAFMNPYEGLETEEKLVCGHETRVRETTEIPSDNILLPKPKNKDPYCFVCRVQYSDYLEHVDAQTHKRNIGKSKYEGYILELESEYGSRRILQTMGRRCSKRKLTRRR